MTTTIEMKTSGLVRAVRSWGRTAEFTLEVFDGSGGQFNLPIDGYESLKKLGSLIDERVEVEVVVRKCGDGEHRE